MGTSLFIILLALSVGVGIKAVWTKRLQISSRKQVVGPLAAKLGWYLIAMPVITVASIATCVVALKLLQLDDTAAYGQGSLFGIVAVLLGTAYTISRVTKYGVPIPTGEKPLDWTTVKAKSESPDFSFLQPGATRPSDSDKPADA